jgi:uncharacterized protein YigE (DUF2233 family)
MIKPIFKYFICLLLFSTLAIPSFSQCPVDNDSLLTYCVNPKKQTLKFYWKDDQDQPFRNFENLKNWLGKKGQTLLFAMNGGMYKTDNSPLGLFIDSGKTIRPINMASASGNFYLKPNGVFYITYDNKATICTTEKFETNSQIKYATQSGPMLVIDGKIHPEFKNGSTNVNIRNGVGILPNGQFCLSCVNNRLHTILPIISKRRAARMPYISMALSRRHTYHLKIGSKQAAILASS